MDSSFNHITVHKTDAYCTGARLLVCRLVDEPGRGYLALAEEGGTFGTESCPSSYGRPCMTWFGLGERYPDEQTALNAVQTRESPRIEV